MRKLRPISCWPRRSAFLCAAIARATIFGKHPRNRARPPAPARRRRVREADRPATSAWSRIHPNGSSTAQFLVHLRAQSATTRITVSSVLASQAFGAGGDRRRRLRRPSFTSSSTIAALNQTAAVVGRSSSGTNVDSATPTTLVSRADVARTPWRRPHQQSLQIITDYVPACVRTPTTMLHMRGGHQVELAHRRRPGPQHRISPANRRPAVIDPKDIDYLYRSGDMWSPKVEQTEALGAEAKYLWIAFLGTRRLLMMERRVSA